MASEEELFCRMAERKSISFNPDGFELSSGLTSVIKIDLGRIDVTEAPDFLKILGEKTLEILKTVGAFNTDKQICLIGVPTAGVAVAQAASAIHFQRTITADVVFRMIRPFVSQDSFGKNRRLWTHGDPTLDQHYWIIDNVCTTAGALLGVYSKLLEHGYPAEQISVLTLVERELNGLERLKERGIPESHIAVGWKITELIGRMQNFGFMSDALPSDIEKIIRQEIVDFHTSPPF